MSIISELVRVITRKPASHFDLDKVHGVEVRAKLELIDLNVEKAQELLDEAYELGKDNDLKKLTKIVNRERKAVKDQMMNYKKMVDSKASLYERLQESQID